MAERADRLFGTDGVRGLAGVELTKELAFELGASAVAVLGRHGEGAPVVVVGRDTRESGEWLEDALVEGIRSAGGHVVQAGVAPTPAIAFATVDSGFSCGAVISASHNPPEYNGIKFFGRTGSKLSDDLEDEIEALLGDVPTPARVPGHVRPAGDARSRYLDHLVAAADGRLEGMTIVVDCANGAASVDAPEVLRRLGATVHPAHCAPNGSNINVGCGALHPEVVAAEVARLGADAGVSLDGDADRALFADARGEVIDGDQVLAACAIDMRERGALAGNTVVSTVMANLGFRRAMEGAGIDVIAARVGDRYVLEEMRRAGAVLGGEQSGHVIFADHATTGDGMLTAVRFPSTAVRRGLSVGELSACMRRYPQVIENVEVLDRGALDGADRVWRAVRDAEAALRSTGRVLVRASGTEPLVRVMVEAETLEDAERHARAVAAEVREVLA